MERSEPENFERFRPKINQKSAFSECCPNHHSTNPFTTRPLPPPALSMIPNQNLSSVGNFFPKKKPFRGFPNLLWEYLFGLIFFSSYFLVSLPDIINSCFVPSFSGWAVSQKGCEGEDALHAQREKMAARCSRRNQKQRRMTVWSRFSCCPCQHWWGVCWSFFFLSRNFSKFE